MSLLSTGCDMFDSALERRVGSPATACVSHGACSAALGSAAVCVDSTQRCVALASRDCQVVGQSAIEDRAIVLGLLRSGASDGLARQQSAQLAIEHLNAVDGVPSAGQGVSRRLVLVSCDAGDNLERASGHLLEELRVPAILGPDTEESASLLVERSAAVGTLLLSPTLMRSAASVAPDNRSIWTMVPSAEQRAPLLQRMLDDLAQQLRAERGRESVRLGLLYRADGLGNSVHSSFESLQLDGRVLSELAMHGASVLENSFDASESRQAEAVAAQLAFAPDVVLLAGEADASLPLVSALEQGWHGDARPYYLFVETLESAQRLGAAFESAELRARVRGIGALPSERAALVNQAFRVDYAARYPDDDRAPLSGTASTFDATFALAYALAATREQSVSGASIAKGLRLLSAGVLEVELMSTKVLAAFQQLTAGKAVRVIGAMGPLGWDQRGVPKSGSVEAWCITEGREGPSVRSSGLRYDIAAKRLTGVYTQCAADKEDRDAGLAASGADPVSDMLDAAVPPPSAGNGAAAIPDATDTSHGNAVGADAGTVSVQSGLTMQYWTLRPSAMDDVIAPTLQITNESARMAAPLGSLKARYYFSNEQAAQCPDNCLVEVLWSGLHPSGANAGAKARYVAISDEQACLEVSFAASAGSLPVGQSVEVQLQFHTTPYRQLDESDDYSFDPSKSQPSDSKKVTLYRDDVLVWGTPPP